jgi:hypothetical protein
MPRDGKPGPGAPEKRTLTPFAKYSAAKIKSTSFRGCKMIKII